MKFQLKSLGCFIGMIGMIIQFANPLAVRFDFTVNIGNTQVPSICACEQNQNWTIRFLTATVTVTRTVTRTRTQGLVVYVRREKCSRAAKSEVLEILSQLLYMSKH